MNRDIEEVLLEAWHGKETIPQITYRIGLGLTPRQVRRAFDRMKNKGLVPSSGRPHNKPGLGRQRPYSTLDKRGVDKLLEKLNAVHYLRGGL